MNDAETADNTSRQPIAGDPPRRAVYYTECAECGARYSYRYDRAKGAVIAFHPSATEESLACQWRGSYVVHAPSTASRWEKEDD